MNPLLIIRSVPGFRTLAIAVLLRAASAPTANLSFVVLALYALSGRMAAIQALTLTWLFMTINPALFPSATLSSTLRYLVLLSGVLTLMRPSLMSGSGSRAFRATFLLAVLLLLHSITFSTMTDISVMKTVAWMLTMLVLIGCYGGLSEQKQHLFDNFLFFVLIGTMLASVPLLFMGAGRATNGTGFQGVFGHPQTMGITAAITGALVTLRIISFRHVSWGNLLLMSVCVSFVFLSEARTGLVAMVLGVAIAVSTGSLLSGRSIGSLMPGLRNPKLMFFFVFATVMAPIIVVFFSDQVVNFLQKRTQSQTLTEAYVQSRGGLIDDMLENIERNPLTGIGFGIGSTPEEMQISRDPILDLPVSALTEKGVLPVAIIEELGFLTGIPVFIWIAYITFLAAQAGVDKYGLVLVFLLVNMGEATLFSPGGAGQLGLIIIAMSVAEARRTPRGTPPWPSIRPMSATLGGTGTPDTPLRHEQRRNSVSAFAESARPRSCGCRDCTER